MLWPITSRRPRTVGGTCIVGSSSLLVRKGGASRSRLEMALVRRVRSRHRFLELAASSELRVSSRLAIRDPN